MRISDWSSDVCSSDLGEFAKRARMLSSALYRVGCRKQDRVAHLTQNRIEQCEIYGAGELAGFISAGINFRLTAEEIAFQIIDCAARVFFFEERYLATVDAVRTRLVSVVQFVCIGAAPDWAVDYATFLASGDTAGAPFSAIDSEIGGASCRERVYRYV